MIVVNVMIPFIIILALAAIGGVFTEKCGVINLSIEAFMTFGGIMFAIIMGQQSLRESPVHQFWIYFFGGGVTVLVGLLYAFITVTLKANQTIAGIALNALALAISLFLIRSPVNPAEGTPPPYIKVADNWWHVGAGSSASFGFISSVSIVGVPLIIGLIILMNKTKLGKHIIAVGENPYAAASLGINVIKIKYIAIMLSSCISGIAGAMYANSSIHFYGSANGLGFLAVALVIFGQWKPFWIASGAVIFGSLTSIFNNYELIPGLNTLGAYRNILKSLPFVLSLSVLVFTSKLSKAPKTLGVPYQNMGR